jgi:hypothetical protein
MEQPYQTEDGWAWDWVDNSQTPQNGPDVIAKGVMDNATVSQGNDQWGGWFRSIASGVIDYAAEKDLITSGVAPRMGTAASGQPVYMQSPYGKVQQQPQGISNTMLLAFLGVAMALALKKG